MNISKRDFNRSFSSCFAALNYSVVVIFYFDQPKNSWLYSKYAPILFQWKWEQFKEYDNSDYFQNSLT